MKDLDEDTSEQVSMKLLNHFATPTTNGAALLADMWKEYASGELTDLLSGWGHDLSEPQTIDLLCGLAEALCEEGLMWAVPTKVSNAAELAFA